MIVLRLVVSIPDDAGPKEGFNEMVSGLILLHHIDPLGPAFVLDGKV